MSSHSSPPLPLTGSSSNNSSVRHPSPLSYSGPLNNSNAIPSTDLPLPTPSPLHPRSQSSNSGNNNSNRHSSQRPSNHHHHHHRGGRSNSNQRRHGNVNESITSPQPHSFSFGGSNNSRAQRNHHPSSVSSPSPPISEEIMHLSSTNGYDQSVITATSTSDQFLLSDANLPLDFSEDVRFSDRIMPDLRSPIIRSPENIPSHFQSWRDFEGNLTSPSPPLSSWPDEGDAIFSLPLPHRFPTSNSIVSTTEVTNLANSGSTHGSPFLEDTLLSSPPPPSSISFSISNRREPLPRSSFNPSQERTTLPPSFVSDIWQIQPNSFPRMVPVHPSFSNPAVSTLNNRRNYTREHHSRASFNGEQNRHHRNRPISVTSEPRLLNGNFSPSFERSMRIQSVGLPGSSISFRFPNNLNHINALRTSALDALANSNIRTFLSSHNGSSQVRSNSRNNSHSVNTSNDESQSRPKSKFVYNLYCKCCQLCLSQRAMKAILLADGRIELFSTDCPTSGPTILIDADYMTKSCSCRLRDIGCSRCGNILGYHVSQPCPKCLNSPNNGHFWMFHAAVVTSSPRLDENKCQLTWQTLLSRGHLDPYDGKDKRLFYGSSGYEAPVIPWRIEDYMR